MFHRLATRTLLPRAARSIAAHQRVIAVNNAKPALIALSPTVIDIVHRQFSSPAEKTISNPDMMCRQCEQVKHTQSSFDHLTQRTSRMKIYSQQYTSLIVFNFPWGYRLRTTLHVQLLEYVARLLRPRSVSSLPFFVCNCKQCSGLYIFHDKILTF